MQINATHCYKILKIHINLIEQDKQIKSVQ